MKHTPTPWDFDGDGFDSIAAQHCDTDGYTIFPVDEDGIAVGCIAEIIDTGDDEECKANAELIVKAVNAWNNPKLLRARLIEMGW